ncbi:MAG: hypothetical protein R3B38_00780 [Patescibacteria group bacterium]
MARNEEDALVDSQLALPLHVLFWWITLSISPKMVWDGFISILSAIYWWIRLKERRELVARRIQQRRLERRVDQLERASNSIAATLRYRTEEVRARDASAVQRLQKEAQQLVTRSIELEKRIADAHPVLSPSRKENA